MDKTACVAFMTATVKTQPNQMPVQKITENTSFIVNLFQSFDADEDGRLTKADFIRFYHQKSMEKDGNRAVWQNLESHGIGKDLKPGVINDTDMHYNDDLSIIRCQDRLPRYFIAADEKLLNSLFSLEEALKNSQRNHYSEAMDSVWKLIGQLKTSP